MTDLTTPAGREELRRILPSRSVTGDPFARVLSIHEAHDLLDAADAGEWREEPPTEPGWYWWRHPSWSTTIVQIHHKGHGSEVCELVPYHGYSAVCNVREGGEWAGPLLPPPPARAAGEETSRG